MAVGDYPEHDRMAERREELDIIGSFLEWLIEVEELAVVRYEEGHGGAIERSYGIETLLAMYTDIDPQKLAEEKDKMLRALREMQPKSTEQKWRDVLRGPHK